MALTGAGISTESGIPDFTGPDGLWSILDPSSLSHGAFRKLAHYPEQFPEMVQALRQIAAKLRKAQPSAGHLALARLEKLGKLISVVTQNIDGLHQMAGSTEVIEIHGSCRTVTCLECGTRQRAEPYLEKLLQGGRPLCECGGGVRPDVVLFGDLLPQGALGTAIGQAKSCDALLCVGSSLVVYPAAGLVDIARWEGASVIIVNREETAKDELADVVLQGEIGEILPALVDRVEEALED